MIYSLLINSVAVFITARILKGVEVKSLFTSILVAIVLGLVNIFIKPLIVILTLPVTILTLGLFLLVINALMIMLVDSLIDDFKVKSFGWAFVFAIVLSLVSGLLTWIF